MNCRSLHFNIKIFLFLTAVSLLAGVMISCGSAPVVKRSRLQGLSNIRYVPDQFVIKPPMSYQLDAETFSLLVYSRSFAQGDAVYMEILPQKAAMTVSDIQVSYYGMKIPLTKKKWGLRGFFAIPPEAKPGNSDLLIKYKSSRNTNEITFPIKIFSAHFKVFKKALDLGAFSNESSTLSKETLAFIEECSKRKKKAFSERINDCITSAMSHPRDFHYITSEFFSRREYMRYREENGKRVYLNNTGNTHYGIDFRGPPGSPVYAMLAGKASLAGLMHYEGNMVILDHGNGIFTYYMHMSKLLIHEGDMIEAGEQIGEVGSTGMSTGPHLHVALLINGISADPLSLIPLPIRD
jgi:murein DD-endopeptidase MepM/ murein hydrolase activator NlpD